MTSDYCPISFEIWHVLNILPKSSSIGNYNAGVVLTRKFCLNFGCIMMEALGKFKNFFVNETQIDADCFRRGQLQSKLWLVNELKKLKLYLGTVYLCAGWYATLATMLFESKIKLDKIRSFDIDPSCVDIAEVFLANSMKLGEQK